MITDNIIEKKLKKKLSEAIEYLKNIGATEIILFGSMAHGNFNEFSDIDLAIRGISPKTYFKTIADLSSIIHFKVDLVLLDYVSKEFKEKIMSEGELVYAA